MARAAARLERRAGHGRHDARVSTRDGPASMGRDSPCGPASARNRTVIAPQAGVNSAGYLSFATFNTRTGRPAGTPVQPFSALAGAYPSGLFIQEPRSNFGPAYCSLRVFRARGARTHSVWVGQVRPGTRTVHVQAPKLADQLERTSPKSAREPGRAGGQPRRRSRGQTPTRWRRRVIESSLCRTRDPS
jgi:hypothetical protein